MLDSGKCYEKVQRTVVDKRHGLFYIECQSQPPR